MKQAEIWSLDTEDDSCGNIYLINFYDGKKHHTFRDRQECLDWFQQIRGNVQIWTTNLGYDLVNLFGPFLSVLEITYIESRVISAKVIGTQIHFRDSLNHWKISVAEMGKRIGLRKIETINGDFNNVEYCQRDTEITWKFVTRMAGYYEKIGCKLKATIGSTALEFYHSHYGTRPTTRLFQKHEIEFMLRGYYGGRVEIFHTAPVTGNIQYYDFNSLYPACMLGNFPVLEGASFTKTPKLKEHDGIVKCTVRSPDMSIPYLPFRDDCGRLLFPTGTFSGYWTFFEIREALKLGYELLDVRSAIQFPRGTFQPFRAFVEDVYQQRLEAKAANDDLLADSFKLLANNLYGKYAQGNEITKLIPRGSTELKHGDQIYGDLLLRKERGAYPIHSNVVWAAYVTAYGRDKLFRAMCKVQAAGGLLIYCDTDSIIFESSEKLIENETVLGGLKSEGDFEYAHFKLPKLYKMVRRKDRENVYRAKGVPRNSARDFFETGRAEFKRPYKLKESLRRNLNPKRTKKIIPNYWDTTSKEILKTYDKRKVLENGKTEPIRIA